MSLTPHAFRTFFVTNRLSLGKQQYLARASDLCFFFHCFVFMLVFYLQQAVLAFLWPVIGFLARVS